MREAAGVSTLGNFGFDAKQLIVHFRYLVGLVSIVNSRFSQETHKYLESQIPSLFLPAA